MTLSPLVLSTIFGIVCIALIAAHFTSRRAFLSIVGFSIPLLSIRLFVGVNVFFYLLVGPLSIFLSLWDGSKRFRHHGIKRYKQFVLYVFLLSACWMTIDYLLLHRYEASRILNLGIGQTELKMPVQLISMMCQLSALWIIPTHAHSHSDVKAGVRGLTLGCLFSVVLGVLLLAITGNGVMGRPTGASFLIDGGSLARIGGFSEEPKHLGALLVVVLAFHISQFAFERNFKNERRNLITIMILIAGLFLTYSTSAWLGIAMVALTQFTLGYWWRGGTKTKGRRAVLLTAVLAFAVVATQATFVSTIVKNRITNRLLDKETAELEESKDHLVWDIYYDQPHMSIFGFGMGGTDLETIPYFIHNSQYEAHHHYSRTPTASTNGIRLLGDIGLFGLFLFSWAVADASKRLRQRGYQVFAVFGITGFVGLMFVSLNVISCYLFLLGAGIATLRIGRNQHQS